MRRTFGDATNTATQSQNPLDTNQSNGMSCEMNNDSIMKSIDLTDVDRRVDVDVSRAGNYLDIDSSTSTLSDCRLTRRKASPTLVSVEVEEDVSLTADKRTWAFTVICM